MAGSFLGGLAGGLGGGAIGSAVVQLFLDDDKYKAQLATAQGQTATAATKMGGAFTAFKAVAGTAALAAGAALVHFGAQAVQAASDQNEQLSKSKVVFGEASDAVVEFSDTSAESFAISKTAALEAAGGFGVMLQTAGLTSQASADMSLSLVKLAGDLASFNNISVDDALLKLKSGLAGEAEPLRTVGILLSEARVKAEAYASGIAKNGAELTEAQKVQARYNLILKDSSLAQGDFSRTSDSLANQQRVLTATLDDLSAEIGQQLLPALEDLLPILIDFAKTVGPAVSFALKVMTGELVAMLGPINDVKDGWHALFGDIGSNAPTGARLVLVLAEQFKNLQVQSQSATDAGRHHIDVLNDYRHVADTSAGASHALDGALKDLAADQRDVARATQAHTTKLIEQRQVELELAGGVLGLLTASTSYTDALADLNKLQDQGKQGTEEYRQATEDALNESIGFEGAVDDLASSINDGETSFADAKEALRLFGVQHGIATGDTQAFIHNALDPVSDRLAFLRGLADQPFDYLFDGKTSAAFDAAYAKLLNARVLAGRFDPTGTGDFGVGGQVSGGGGGGGGGGRGGGGVTVNVNGDVYDGEKFVAKVKDALRTTADRSVLI